MNDDLNSPIVIAHLSDAARFINSVYVEKAKIAAKDIQELQNIFHLFLFDILGLKEESSSNKEREEAFGKVVDLLLDERLKAKNNKDWVTSDKIRDELAALGFNIKDNKEGTEWILNK